MFVSKNLKLIIMKTKSLIVLVTSVVIAVITCSFTMKSDTQWITVSGYVDNTNGDVISQVDVTCTLNRLKKNNSSEICVKRKGRFSTIFFICSGVFQVVEK